MMADKFTRLTLACLCCMLFLAPQLMSQQPAGDATASRLRTADTPVPSDPTVRIGVLPNGLTYYIKANQKPENRAEISLAVKAGSMQEDEDQLGLAHFVEHMAFNGTEHFSKNELVSYLERVGSRFGPDLNAYTSFDETVYMLQVRTDDEEQFDNGLLILRDWANGVSFDDEEIDKERGVVISEWRTGLSAQQRMRNEYFPVMYYNSRYANRLPIGDPEIVGHAKYDVVRRFYADWYRPGLMAVLVVGAVDPDIIEKKLADRFGDITAKAPVRAKESDAVPPHPYTFVRIVTDPEATGANVQMIHNHKHVRSHTMKDYRDRLVQSLYNRMLGRRLSDLAKEADPPFLFGYTGYGQDVGDLATYSSFASAKAKDIARAFRTLLEENQRVLQHGFTDAELEREKAQIMLSAETALKEEDKMESSRVIQRLVYHFLEENPIPSAAQHLEIYKSMMPTITVGEVSALARQWITDENRLILVTAPEKDSELLPDSAGLIRILREVSQMKMTPYEDADLSAPLLPGEFPEQPVLNYSVDKSLGIHRWTFANGVKVHARPTAFKNDEILMNAYSPGGHSLYPDAMFPSARSASSVVSSSGVGSYTAAALEKKLTGTRANAGPFIFERYEGLNGFSSVKDQETMLQLAYSYVTAFRRDTDALSSWLQRERTRFENILSNPQNWFSDKLTRIISQNHPRRGFPSLESYDEVNLDDILRIYGDRFADVSDMEFFFVGNFDPDSLQRITSRYLGALPGGGRKETPKDIGVRYPSGRIDSAYNRGEAPKSLVQLVYHGKDAYDPDAAYVLQSLIDVARIKLREALREDDSGVYGVSVGGGQSKHPVEQYSINISFNADPVRTEELTQSAHRVIARLKEYIDPDDILKITEAQRQGRIKALEQNQFWMNAMLSAWMDESDDLAGYIELGRLEKRIAMITPEVLQAAARKYFDDREVITITLFPERT